MDRLMAAAGGDAPKLVGRRRFLEAGASFTALTALSACGVSAPAQRRPPIVGFVPLDTAANPGLVEEFLLGLREAGYEHGVNVRVEWRALEPLVAAGIANEDGVTRLTAELLALPVDVLVANGGVAHRVTKRSTSVTPIVMVTGVDPVEAGLIESLAKPGGNMTGIAGSAKTTGAKSLELLKEAAPSTSRVAIVGGLSAEVRDAVGTAAGRLGLEAVHVEAASGAQVPELIEAAVLKRRVDALLLLNVPGLVTGDKNVIATAAKYRLPAAYGSTRWPDAGGFMCFTANLRAIFHRGGNYVGRILNGKHPADMPVEEPTKFDFVINLKTATELGLTLPQSLISRTTRVIE